MSAKANIKKIIVSLFSILFFYGSPLIGQYQHLKIGGGVAVVHALGQSDFMKSSLPKDVFIQFQRGNAGIRMDYSWDGLYIKENFSFELNHLEISLVYDLKEVLKIKTFSPYVRLGANKWSSSFTTEGYPGITDYDLKIEYDRGYGITAGAGIFYPVGSVSVGIEGHYSKNGISGFVAGGFQPQPFLSDQIRALLTLNYKIPIRTYSKKGFAIVCPKF